MPKAKPPVAVPYLTVGFGSKPQRLRLPPGVTEAPKPITAKTKPVGVTAPSRPAGVTTSKLPVGAAPAGRPPSNLGRYLIRPTPTSDTGFEMLNDQPDAIAEVERKFLDLKMLPTKLRPTRLAHPDHSSYTKRPAVLEANRAKAISRGWRDPRGRKG
jgi:hypothetical protein